MKKPMFTLSRRNQKGQVAIFVALIFQVIFVFFALLVNIGLLVHHKINLQQSTDLAAYYGAMKQAESLNAMAHVNFQIRQAWKLLAWRYRVLGTFGNEKENGAPPLPMLPITLAGGGGSKISDLGDFNNKRCTGTLENTADLPFFCVGHAGFKYWSAAENVCKINCEILKNSTVQVGGVQINPVSSATGAAVVTALHIANDQITKACQQVTGANIKVLAQLILSYRTDMMARSKTFAMLAGNLSTDASRLKDLDGQDVQKGVENTLKNNLTEANRTGLSKTISSYNSLSHPNCSIDPQNPANKRASKREFVKRIEFDFINFFLHSCMWQPTPTSTDDNNGIAHYNPGSIFNKTGGGMADGSPLIGSNGLPVTVTPPGKPTYPISTVKIHNPPNNGPLLDVVEQEIMKLITNENEKFSVGYEKDPWCPAYFVVQAQATPRIPFLPLIEIKLNAVAVAKPFGGSIGPWFGRNWESGATTSQAGLGAGDQAKQTDEMLPTNNTSGAPPSSLNENTRLLPNFSRFVGDNKGLSDPYYLAQYHSALINHEPTGGVGLFGGNSSVVPDSNADKDKLIASDDELSLNSWFESADMDAPKYDPIVGGETGHDSFLRALELSAIAPNQFDLTYYSIDPDFYNNYFLKLQTNYDVLNDNSGKIGPSKKDYIRPDFGYNKRIYSNELEFSVRNQIQIVNKTFGSNFTTKMQSLGSGSPNFIDYFPELVKKQSSLLTGWTFKNFTDFTSFPGNDMILPEDTMNFARCSDPWQDSGGQPEFKTPKSMPGALPSTPGNCVTGGRVGYSVKLISPKSLSLQQTLGGLNSKPGVIQNPLPTKYLIFP